MSTFTRPGRKFWEYDFRRDGHRFHGSFDGTNGRPRLTVDRPKKEADRAEALVRASIVPGSQRTELSLHDAAARYWTEAAQHFADASGEWGRIAHLERLLGKKTGLHALTDDDLARYVSTRRGEKARNKETLISNATLNRELECLGRIIRRARKWNALVPDISIGAHKLPEPKERVRSLTMDEDQSLFEAMDKLRPDFRDVFEFKLLTGKRLSEVMFLEKRRVDRRAMRATAIQKGGQEIVISLTVESLAILERNWMHHPTRCFTYICARNRTWKDKAGATHHQRNGKRYPFTRSGWRKVWKDILTDAGIVNFRPHDIRHTTATRILAATGNLKLVQKALSHSDISTTAKYAHTDVDQERAALEAAASLRTPTKVPTEKKADGEKA